MIPIVCYTVCYGRAHHLAETLPVGTALLESCDRWIVANAGNDSVAHDLCVAYGVEEVDVPATGEPWNLNALRNQLLAHIPDDVLSIQVDADNFLSQENIDEARRWIEKYGDGIMLHGCGRRGPHGRVAALAGKVRELGGWCEEIHPRLPTCVDELLDRARDAGMLVKKWRSGLGWIEHD